MGIYQKLEDWYRRAVESEDVNSWFHNKSLDQRKEIHWIIERKVLPPINEKYFIITLAILIASFIFNPGLIFWHLMFGWWDSLGGVDDDLPTMEEPTMEDIEITRMGCTELVDYHNNQVEFCMEAAKEGVREGYFDLRVYDECYPERRRQKVRNSIVLSCNNLCVGNHFGFDSVSANNSCPEVLVTTG